jgi:transposase-like protein
MSKSRHPFSPEFKVRAVMGPLPGPKRRVEIFHEQRLHYSTMERWCQQFEKRGARILADYRTDALYKTRVAEPSLL